MEIRLRHCVIRPWRYEDRASLVVHANDERIARQLRDIFPNPYTAKDAEAWLSHATSAGRRLAFALEVDGEAAGGIGLIPGEDVHRLTAQVGYWLGVAHWGRGIVTEALGAFSEHLLGERGFLRLEAGVYASNPASARVLEKCGYHRESVQRRAAVKNGQLLDMWLYVRLAPDDVVARSPLA
ncbi:MAG: GNAT family N-acetyltransferase [Sandaracinaceae bacterium]